VEGAFPVFENGDVGQCSIVFNLNVALTMSQEALGKISFTSDLWSDKNLRSYLCLTAHWIARNKRTGVLELKCALIAFHNVTGRHDGVNLGRIMLALLDRAGVTLLVGDLLIAVVQII
jgi:hypothetical protein